MMSIHQDLERGHVARAFERLGLEAALDLRRAREELAPLFEGLVSGEQRVWVQALMERSGDALAELIDRRLMEMYAAFMRAPTAYESEHPNVETQRLLELLVLRHEDFVQAQCHRFARRYGLDSENASDLVSEVFLTLMRRAGSFDGSKAGSFRGWLTTITRNKAIDLSRKHARDPTLSDTARGVGVEDGPRGVADFLDETSLSADTMVLREQARATFARLYADAMARMERQTPRRHEAWVLLVERGMASHEASAHSGTAAATLRRNKKLAQDTLRHWLTELCQDHGLTPSELLGMFEPRG